MAAHALGERQHVREPGAILLGRSPRRVAAVREQVIAGSLGRREAGAAGRESLYGQLQAPSPDALRVGKVRYAVGAHAVGEGHQSVLRRRGGSRGGCDTRNPRRAPAAATAGREQREGGNRDDGAEGEWTTATHAPVVLLVESAAIRHTASSPAQPERIAAPSERLLRACLESAYRPSASKRSVRSAPPPSALATVTLPPWSSTVCLTIASPSPEPGRARAAGAR